MEPEAVMAALPPDRLFYAAKVSWASEQTGHTRRWPNP